MYDNRKYTLSVQQIGLAGSRGSDITSVKWYKRAKECFNVIHYTLNENLGSILSH